jgi:hypothetical protein
MKPMEVKEKNRGKNQRQKRKGGGGKAIKKLNGKGAKRQ